ncbi:unnamed protein product [Bursaphelenchus okinawaensis]|uniref:RNase NYN domain-containing protein n=1 Tax=Bursaphelenchus okinawaensis TaxID=465554 RepID=A0A811LM55_9BILA|nr:unnamed protein product [Bursaphelenchus okinawaensis]CAG9127900.1 unnamed protein product [Bursaphelenchus okinawaensis]
MIMIGKFNQSSTVFRVNKRKEVEDDVKEKKADVVVPKELKVEYCRRVVVIDGCNVISKASKACYSIHSAREKANALTLLLMVNDLISKKFEVFVTLKDYYMNARVTDYYFVIEQFQLMEILHVLPDMVDDDRVILNTAVTYNGAIISNDRFRDKEGEFEDVKRRRIDFNYDLIPWESKEVLAKRKLQFGLKFNYTALKRNSLCSSSMPDYPNVKKLYDSISPMYFESTKRRLDIMASYVQLEQCYAYAVPLNKPVYLQGDDIPSFYEYMERRIAFESRKNRINS